MRNQRLIWWLRVNCSGRIQIKTTCIWISRTTCSGLNLEETKLAGSLLKVLKLKKLQNGVWLQSTKESSLATLLASTLTAVLKAKPHWLLNRTKTSGAGSSLEVWAIIAFSTWTKTFTIDHPCCKKSHSSLLFVVVGARFIPLVATRILRKYSWKLVRCMTSKKTNGIQMKKLVWILQDLKAPPACFKITSSLFLEDITKNLGL